jgi:rhamnosyltransferase
MNNIKLSTEKIKIIALIVCYFPDKKILLNLVSKLNLQVTKILILDNGGIKGKIYSDLSAYKNLNLVSFGENIGIASALNYGFDFANRENYEFAITFDQDSDPSINMVAGLVYTWKSIRNINPKIGAIGPKFYDSRGGVSYPFLSMKGSGFFVNKIYSALDINFDVSPVDLLITSGMLVPVSMWMEGYKFNDDLFVDYVDTEWCFRVKNNGFQNYGYFGEQMNHQVSDSAGFNFLGMMVLSYSPIRRYFYYRNTIKYLHFNYVPFGNKLRILFGLLIRTPFIFFVDLNPIRSLKFAFLGLLDGIAGQGGSFPSKYLD